MRMLIRPRFVTTPADLALAIRHAAAEPAPPDALVVLLFDASGSR